jgi:uncharacterized protein DUF11
MRLATIVAACALVSLTGCNVVLGFGEPTGGADHDLNVTIVESPVSNPAYFGFQVNVSNNGPDNDEGVCVDVFLPPESGFGGGTGTCSPGQGTFTTCCIPALAAFDRAELKLSALLVDGTIAAGVQVPDDPNASNDHATIEMHSRADLETLRLIDGGNSDVVGPGQSQSYTFRVTNLGPGYARSVKVDIATTPGFVAQGFSGINWTCDALTCTLDSLPPGAHAYSLKWTALTPTTAGSTMVTGTVSSPAMDPDLGNNSTNYLQTVTP